MKLTNKTHIALGLILILGLILRLVALFKYGNFWDDEMFNFIYSQKTWPQGFIYWLWETNPPLHMLILKLWFFVFPANELFARLPSVAAGCASIYFIYRLGKELFDEKTALLAAFYLAIHPYNIFWSATARIYSFLMLFATISAFFLYKQFFLNDDSRKLKIYSAIINGLLIFSHLSSLFFLTGQFFALAIFKGKTAVINWIKYNLAPFILGAGWILTSLYIKRNNSLDQAWFLNLAPAFKNYLNPLVNILVGQLWLLPGLILIILSCALVIYKLYKTKSTELLFLAILITIPVIISFALGVWHIKFVMTVLPLAVLAISYSFSEIFSKFYSIFIITSVCLVGLFNLWNTLPLTDWQQVEGLFKKYETSDGFVFVYNSYLIKTQIDRYLSPEVAQNSKTVVAYKDMSWDDMVVKKNYVANKLSSEEKDQWYKDNKMDDYSIVALLQDPYHAMTRLDDLFEKNGWKLKNPPVVARIGDYKMYIYVKD